MPYSCCIILKNYIKPQLKIVHTFTGEGCIILKNYIKPQLVGGERAVAVVV